jgi:hypothetical protein
VLIVFTGLPSGTHPVHLHSACDGHQRFHISVLATLIVGARGTGGVDVPAADTARGWCLIVYGDASLARVLATRAI